MRLYLVLAAALAAVVTFGWLHYAGLVDDKERAEKANELLSDKVEELIAERDMVKQDAERVRELNDRTRRELDDAESENAELLERVDAGDVRLSVNAACPAPDTDLPGAAAAVGRTYVAAVELAPDSRQDYKTLLDQIDADRIKILGLQEYITGTCQREVVPIEAPGG